MKRSCQPCPSGHISNGQGPCVKCPAGYYASRGGEHVTDHGYIEKMKCVYLAQENILVVRAQYTWI